jgi:hypothetical protein
MKTIFSTIIISAFVMISGVANAKEECKSTVIENREAIYLLCSDFKDKQITIWGNFFGNPSLFLKFYKITVNEGFHCNVTAKMYGENVYADYFCEMNFNSND